MKRKRTKSTEDNKKLTNADLDGPSESTKRQRKEKGSHGIRTTSAPKATDSSSVQTDPEDLSHKVMTDVQAFLKEGITDGNASQGAKKEKRHACEEDKFIGLETSPRKTSSFATEVLSPASTCTSLQYVVHPRSRNREELGLSEGIPSVEAAKTEEDMIPKRKGHHDVNASFRKFVQLHYEELKSELEPDGIADHLLASDVLTSAERETIFEAGFRRNKNEILLMSLVRFSQKIPKNDGSLWQKVKEALTKEKSEHLFQDFDIGSYESYAVISKALTGNDENWRRRLDAFLRLKGDDINPSSILDKLLTKEVITFDEHENIRKIDFYPDRMAYLVKYLKRKSEVEFNKFVDTIKENYPALVEGLNEEHLMDTLKVPDMYPTLLLRDCKMSGPEECSATGVVKLNCNGEGKDVEKSIVDRHLSQTNTDFVQQGMILAEIGMKNMKFSSVSFTIKALSRRSQMMLFKLCKESPERLIEWMKPMFDRNDIKRLLDKNISKIQVKMYVTWEDGLSKQDIAVNFCFLKENLKDPIKIANETQIVNVEHLTHLKTSIINAQLLIQIMNGDDDSVVHFYHALQRLNMSDILMTLRENRIKSYRSCCCRLTKDTITKHFTALVDELTELEEILRTFANFEGFGECDRNAFQRLLVDYENKQTDKTTAKDLFFRQILNMDCDHLEVCLLEEELDRLHQTHLLEHNAETNSRERDNAAPVVLKEEDILRNHSILINEIEPRRLLGMFNGLESMDAIKDSILSSSDRRKRCKLFLEVVKSNNNLLDKFAPELERLRHTKLLSLILDSRRQGFAEMRLTKEDIRRNEGFLKEQLEPRKFLNMLRDVKHSETVIEKILSAAPKRQSCISFIEFLLDGPELDITVLQRFQLELEKLGMNDIVQFLINARRIDICMDITREALIKIYPDIVKEIEPEKMRDIFVERGVISSKDFDEILKHKTRRQRAVCLLQEVLQGRTSKALCMINVLEALGYISLVKQIKKEMETYQSCPRLCKVRLCKENGFTFEANIEIATPEEQQHKQCDDDVKLPSETYDPMAYTEHWLASSSGFITCVDEDDEGISEDKSRTEGEPHDQMQVVAQTVGHLRHHCCQEKRQAHSSKANPSNMSVDSGMFTCLSPMSVPTRNVEECNYASSRSTCSPTTCTRKTKKSRKTWSISSDKTWIYDKDF